MASETAQAKRHRALHTIRPYSWPAETEEGRPLLNPCTWMHDTPCTNRADRRRAFAQADHFGCEEVNVPDKKRGTKTSWQHTPECPKYEKPETDKERVAPLFEGTR